MSYSTDNGFTPLTREEMLYQLYLSAVNESGYTGTLLDFKGSNWHKMLSSGTIPFFERSQADVVDALTNLFSYWQANNMAITGSYGSSYEGWQNNFKALCLGLQIINSADDETLTPAGSVALYFDDLKIDQAEAVEKAFKQSIWPGMITPRGTSNINVNFTSAGLKNYLFYNLTGENYTKIEVKIIVTYKAGGLQYNPTALAEAFAEQFDATMPIGQTFYPESFFDTTTWAGVANFTVQSKLPTDSAFDGNIRPCPYGEKFVLMGAPEVVVA